MRVLLDEHLDRRLRNDFGVEFDVITVEYRGWKGAQNGTLLRLAALEFDAFVTMDRGIEHEQAWQTLDLAIVLVSAKTNRYADLKPLIPIIQRVLGNIAPGQLVLIS